TSTGISPTATTAISRRSSAALLRPCWQEPASCGFSGNAGRAERREAHLANLIVIPAKPRIYELSLDIINLLCSYRFMNLEPATPTQAETDACDIAMLQELADITMDLSR